MPLALVVTFLLILSLALAVWSLKNIQKMEELKEVKKDLNQSKIVFHRDSSSAGE